MDDPKYGRGRFDIRAGSYSANRLENDMDSKKIAFTGQNDEHTGSKAVAEEPLVEQQPLGTETQQQASAQDVQPEGKGGLEAGNLWTEPHQTQPHCHMDARNRVSKRDSWTTYYVQSVT